MQKIGLRSRERIRRQYRPKKIRILFIGESPPASGRFFYCADSGLYRAIRQTFLKAFPERDEGDFLSEFAAMGCYLVDLCGHPVDKLAAKRRRQKCELGEPRLVRTLLEFKPKAVVSIVRSIAPNVARALQFAGFTGQHLNLPYPGRWQRNRRQFTSQLVPVLRKLLRR